MTQILRENATKAYDAGDSSLGAANKSAATALENQIERHLTGLGAPAQPVLADFRAAREKIAKAHDVKDAILIGTGSVNPAVFANKLKEGKLTGDLKTIGEIYNSYPQVMGQLSKTQAPGVNKAVALASMLTGLEGVAATGKAAGAIAGGFPLLSGPARAMALAPKRQISLSGSAAAKPSFMNDTRLRQARLAALLAAQQEQAQ